MITTDEMLTRLDCLMDRPRAVVDFPAPWRGAAGGRRMAAPGSALTGAALQEPGRGHKDETAPVMVKRVRAAYDASLLLAKGHTIK
jgi:hypothetical protein